MWIRAHAVALTLVLRRGRDSHGLVLNDAPAQLRSLRDCRIPLPLEHLRSCRAPARSGWRFHHRLSGNTRLFRLFMTRRGRQ